MTDKQFFVIWTAALAAADRDAFVSDWALSSIWGDAPDADVPDARIKQIGELWDAAHLTAREIRKHTGLSQAAFAARFCIPQRTYESWEIGERSCPPYVLLMLAQLSGAYTRPEM